MSALKITMQSPFGLSARKLCRDHTKRAITPMRGRLEDPEIQFVAQRMTNRERAAWAAGGYKTERPLPGEERIRQRDAAMKTFQRDGS